MTYTPRVTEEIARGTVDGLMDQIMGLINPANDNMLAPWMMARDKAHELVLALNTVCEAIAARPCMNPGQMALRNIAACIPVATPEEDEVFTAYEAEARRVEAKRLEASWNALSDEQKAEAESRLTEEARRIEAAHPTTINMADFAGGLLGIHKRGA